MELGYALKYDKVKELKSTKAPDVLLRCFKNLKSRYRRLDSASLKK
jgi:hypothetical protein